MPELSPFSFIIHNRGTLLQVYSQHSVMKISQVQFACYRYNALNRSFAFAVQNDALIQTGTLSELEAEELTLLKLCQQMQQPAIVKRIVLYMKKRGFKIFQQGTALIVATAYSEPGFVYLESRLVRNRNLRSILEVVQEQIRLELTAEQLQDAPFPTIDIKPQQKKQVAILNESIQDIKAHQL